jgi:hypothetical protein
MLVGWYDQQNRNIFNKDLKWIGFINNGNFFSTSARWIGGFMNGTYVDKKGRPVAWIEGSVPVGGNVLIAPITPMVPLCPLTPLRPLTPLTPLRPLTPLGGWSLMDWNEYIES